MSKDVNVNGMDYLGVSTVQLATTDGGTASFKDVDEIIVPSGSMNITGNGIFDVTEFATAVVNVVSGGGFIASGTFTGDGTNKISVTIPASATVLIVHNDKLATELNDFDVSELPAYSFMSGVWQKDTICYHVGVNYNSSNYIADIKLRGEERFSVSWDDAGNFTDSKLFAGTALKTLSGETYRWVAY